MKLSTTDKDLYYKLYPSLMVYVNNKYGIIPNCSTVQYFIKSIEHQDRMEIRNYLLKNMSLIKEYVRENPDNLLLHELSIIKSWENAIQGKFYIFRHLKKHTIFMESGADAKAYGVLGIESTLKELVPYPPILVDAVLLPFRDQIIYDGLLAGYGVSFGGGIKRSLNATYNEIKQRPGIITSLDQPLVGSDPKQQSDEDKLRYYLKNQSNRDYYQIEIDNIIKKDHKLAVIYYQLIGKVTSKSIGKRLKELGMSPGWYAILEDMIIASGESKDEVVRNAKMMVPKEKDDFIYYYQMRQYKQRK
jgi:hypothetical protein